MLAHVDEERGASQGLDAIEGGIAFYGTRIDPGRLAQVRRPLRLFFASQDKLVPPQHRDQLQQAQAILQEKGVSCDMHVLEGVDHGFVHMASAAGSQRRQEARQAGTEFLNDILS